MAYELLLTDGERDSLAWIAARYESAHILFRGAEWPENDAGDTGNLWRVEIPEHVAWAYVAALTEDNGDESAVLPPCAGGTLAEKLTELWQNIV